ncbi:alpha/beta-hydrolase [Apiospora saccharicola]|uniref:Alpha/beta-hydrolase n=1 Tax=Apiospora saccharicola TaxID=335842 RepID=A0ABR1WGT4_9PEZI
MSMDGIENPAPISEGPEPTSYTRPRAPLILMHDGGGTTFSYHCLEPPTNRALYGIHNAHFDDGGWWHGGLPEMATHYIGLLSEALPEGGDVILGGWSLGGMLSLEMAHQIATQPSGDSSADRRPRFNVLGMVWVDSQCPRAASEGIIPADKQLPAEVVQRPRAELDGLKLVDKVGLNMLNARIMVQSWEKPRWENDAVPPTILLRARESYADPNSSFVDHQRGHRMLGWEGYSKEHGDFVREVVDVEGNHFSLFEDDKIIAISEKINAAVDKLDYA